MSAILYGYLFIHSLSAQNLLNNPESVVFDSLNNRYLVSNWGDGAIVQIDTIGVQSYFTTALQNLFNLAGMYIFGDTLLVAAGNAPGAGILGFNINDADSLFYIPIPEIGLPNDITSDSQGDIYVTDYWGDKLYKIVNHIPSIFVVQGILHDPNGILYDQQNNRLLVLSVTGSGSPILAVGIEDSSVSTVVLTQLMGTDGITEDKAGRIYVSEWTNDKIYRYENTFSNPPEIFSIGHNDPADIYFDRINDLIVVPNFSSHSVDFIPVDPSQVDMNQKPSLNQYKLMQNFPNPFNPGTKISFQIPVQDFITLKIYDSLGNELETLVNEEKPAGKYELNFNATALASGMYFYRIIVGDYSDTKKCVLIK